MELEFEIASPADVLTLRDLAERIWHSSYATMLSEGQRNYMLQWMYAPHKLESEIERGVSYLLVRYERRAIGYMAWELQENGERAHLHKLYLLQEFQGRGFGAQMLSRFLTEARSSGASYAELRVNRNNLRAQKVYAQAGFRVFESVVTDIGAGYVMDDFVLRRDLSAAPLPNDTNARSSG